MRHMRSYQGDQMGRFVAKRATKWNQWRLFLEWKLPLFSATKRAILGYRKHGRILTKMQTICSNAVTCNGVTVVAFLLIFHCIWLLFSDSIFVFTQLLFSSCNQYFVEYKIKNFHDYKYTSTASKTSNITVIVY